MASSVVSMYLLLEILISNAIIQRRLSFSVKSLVQFALLAGRIENVKNREAWGCSGRKPEMKRIRLTISYLSDVRARNTTKRDRSNGQLRADIRIRVISTSVHRTDSAERREQSVI